LANIYPHILNKSAHRVDRRTDWRRDRLYMLHKQPSKSGDDRSFSVTSH